MYDPGLMSPNCSRLIDAFAGGDSGIHARLAGRSIIFTLSCPSEGPDRQVWWNVSDAALASLVTKFSPGAAAAYGPGGDGFAVLISRLDEELETFDGDRGEILIINGRDITAALR